MRYLITINFIHSYWHRQVYQWADIYSPDQIDDLLMATAVIITQHPDKLLVKAAVKFHKKLMVAYYDHIMGT